MDELYTVKEVLGKLKITRATLYRYINEGKITPVKLGGRTLFKESDLEAFINSLPYRKKDGEK